MAFHSGKVSGPLLVAIAVSACFFYPAHDARSDNSRFSVLKTSLTSEEEFLAQLQEVGLNTGEISKQVESRFSKNQIEIDLGATERVSYYDRGDQVFILTTHAAALKGQPEEEGPPEYGGDFSETLQLEVHDFMTALSSKTSNYYQAFAKKGFLDPAAIRSTQIAQLETNYSLFQIGSLSLQDFSHWILAHPKTFSHLPTLLTRTRAAGNTSAALAIREISAKALLLTLDAVQPISSFSNSAYPFFDEIVGTNSLLNVSKLYNFLNPQGLWPKIVDLNLDERQKLGGVYNQKAGERWKVKGFYLETQNQIWVDLENDFYENLFVYFHELWHVAWSHSSFRHDQLISIQDLLKEPDSDSNQKDLRTTVLQFISTNEFLAIDQQVKLFHAIGFDTEDWDAESGTSALAWHDSYIGKDAYRLLIKKSQRGKNWFVRKIEQDDRWVLVLPLSVNEENLEAVHILYGSFLLSRLKKRFDSTYWSNQLAAHSKFFENRYFGSGLGLSKSISPVSPDDVIAGLSKEVYMPLLSCSDIARIRKSLGDTWQFGFPFEHKLSDPQNCPQEQKNAPDGIGTEGSHPGTEGSHPDLGADPEIDAFPSLDGPSQGM